jgi:hypothetical protein
VEPRLGGTHGVLMTRGERAAGEAATTVAKKRAKRVTKVFMVRMDRRYDEV